MPVDHPKFGTSEPCECQVEQRKQQRLETLNAISSRVDFEATFNNFDAERSDCTPEQRRSLREALWWSLLFSRYPDWPEDPDLPDVPFLTLTGKYGCGKTHLARAIWNYRQNPANDTTGATFAVVPDLLDYIRSTFSGHADESYDSRFENIRQTTSVLILDDLGAEKKTDWAGEKVYQIINWRYNHLLPTVVTTNQDPEWLDGRVLDRLTEGVMHAITAASYRSKKANVSGARRFIQRYGKELERADE